MLVRDAQGTDRERLRPPRTVLLAALLAALLIVGRTDVAAQDGPGSRPALRVVVPGGAAPTIRLTPMVRQALERVGAEVAPVRPSEWGDLGPGDADFLLLGRTAVPYLERATAEEIQALHRIVSRGTHLVVTGKAAGALPDSRAYTRLLGRSRESGAPVLRSAPSDVVLLIWKQRHAITQCVPHLFLERARITAVCPEEDSLATALSAGAEVGGGGDETDSSRADTADTADRGDRGVFSIRRSAGGLGRVAVLALETEWSGSPGSPSERKEGGGREREILATLLGRTLEWLARRPVTIHLPDDLPLAASRLGPDDAGPLPGLEPRRGFYRGRQIAPFMTYHGADWLVRPEREKTERPEEVLDSLDLEPGSTVVDLGAGVGYFSERMARRVGPRGKVLAVDIQKEMLELLVQRMDAAGIGNVEPVLATATDPRLPSGRVDLVLMVDVYHELSDPAPVLAGVHAALRKGAPERRPGRLVLVEYRGEDPTIPIKPLHRMTVHQARAELEPVGFRWVETKSFLPHQHVIVFERAERAGRGG